MLTKSITAVRAAGLQKLSAISHDITIFAQEGSNNRGTCFAVQKHNVDQIAITPPRITPQGQQAVHRFTSLRVRPAKSIHWNRIIVQTSP